MHCLLYGHLIEESFHKPFKIMQVKTLSYLSLLFLLIYSCGTADKELTKEPEQIIVRAEPEKSEHTDPPAVKDEPDSYEERPGIKISKSAESPRMSRPASLSGDMSMHTTEGRRETTVLPPDVEVKSGQITAAEWNDLNNWQSWRDLLKNQDYSEMQDLWTLYPRARYSVFVRDKYEMPVQGARVELYNRSGKRLWEARTDNSGKAELWASMFEKEIRFDPLDIVISARGKSLKIQDARNIDEGVNQVLLDVDCNGSRQVDILFVVDATGSMGDEISYLQAELRDVIERSQNVKREISLRLGSVFYRDHEDEYLTRVQDLSGNPESILGFVSGQRAEGGGDYPEAVESALDEALAQDWNPENLANIIFLLLDAPPHQEAETLKKVQRQIGDAAALGIKIIPITASGINRQTEFLMKFMAIATNGTYVFITDHSGIGNPHLDPVVKDFEVEKLNDLLVRLIYNYTKANGCAASQTVNNNIRLFPNPTSNYITLKTEKKLDDLRIYSNSGMLLRTEKNIGAGEKRIDLGDWVDGVYTIVCRYGDEEFSQSVILVSG